MVVNSDKYMVEDALYLYPKALLMFLLVNLLFEKQENFMGEHESGEKSARLCNNGHDARITWRYRSRFSKRSYGERGA